MGETPTSLQLAAQRVIYEPTVQRPVQWVMDRETAVERHLDIEPAGVMMSS